MATDLIFIQTEPYNYNSPFERMNSQSHGNLNSNSHSQNNRSQIHTGNLKNSIKIKKLIYLFDRRNWIIQPTI